MSAITPGHSAKASFYQLTPDHILSAAESFGGRATGHFMALNSYENRVYEVQMEDRTRRVMKFYRPGRWNVDQVNEEHDFLSELEGAEIPTVPPLRRHGQSLFCIQEGIVNDELSIDRNRSGSVSLGGGVLFAAFPKVQGQARSELNRDETAWLGRLIGRMHHVGQARRFEHRWHLNVELYGERSLQFVLGLEHVREPTRVRLESVARPWLSQLDQILARVPVQRIHGDLHASNLLWGEEGPFFLDFDDAVMGPVVQDFWLLISDFEKRDEFLQQFRPNYEIFSEFPLDQLGIINELRKLRRLRHAGWLAERWDDPIFPLSFPYFTEDQFFQELIRDLSDWGDSETRML